MLDMKKWLAMPTFKELYVRMMSPLVAFVLATSRPSESDQSSHQETKWKRSGAKVSR